MARANRMRLDNLAEIYASMTDDERAIVRPLLSGIDKALARIGAKTQDPTPAEQAAFEELGEEVANGAK